MRQREGQPAVVKCWTRARKEAPPRSWQKSEMRLRLSLAEQVSACLRARQSTVGTYAQRETDLCSKPALEGKASFDSRGERERRGR